LIGQEIDNEYTSYHFDFRGSTVALTDKDAQTVGQYQYSPYGLLLSGDSSKTPFLFNGKYGVMTDSNNLYYMRARFYSPEIKRFINQDILLGDVFEGQTLNRYVYTTGNPISKIDPTGRWAWIVLPFCSGGGCEFIAASIAYGIAWFATEEVVYNNIYDEGGSAKTQSPYSHAEEKEALSFTPDPFGGDEACKRLRRAIRILRAIIVWRKTDLNPRSRSYKTHKNWINNTVLSKLTKLERDHRNICGSNCPL